MRPRALTALTCIVCLAALLGAASCGHDEPPAVPAARVLFVGNSFTYVNGGIDAQLKGLAPSVATQMQTVGGATLKDHWDAGEALTAIRSGHFDFVVLQEQSQTPVTGQTLFDQYVRSFDAEIRASGATTVLLMTWERPDSVQWGVTTDGLARSYEQAGAETGASVAPVGLAFAEALRQRPDVTLYVSDGHPTAEGTYLAACVLYGVLYRRSPVGDPFGPADTEDRAFLQGVAAQALGLTGH